MKICRFYFNHDSSQQVQLGFYFHDGVVSFKDAVAAYSPPNSIDAKLFESNQLLDYLPPNGVGYGPAHLLYASLFVSQDKSISRIPFDQIELLVPIPRPNKLLLLAGNYAKHIKEQGGIAAERRDTFPYVFMKPPSTTLTHPSSPVIIPEVSPNAIDYECELAVIIGKKVKNISEANALTAVAGYTILNDISDRKFTPNADRKEREKDRFFDWLHGKWHDSFCPCGPCITTVDEIQNPQDLAIKLSVNGEVRQDSSTSQQIFPVAAVIEFISSFVTLEPGDIISTGTPSGVGNATGTYLADGDLIEASIESIGTLTTKIQAN